MEFRAVRVLLPCVLLIASCGDELPTAPSEGPTRISVADGGAVERLRRASAHIHVDVLTGGADAWVDEVVSALEDDLAKFPPDGIGLEDVVLVGSLSLDGASLDSWWRGDALLVSLPSSLDDAQLLRLRSTVFRELTRRLIRRERIAIATLDPWREWDGAEPGIDDEERFRRLGLEDAYAFSWSNIDEGYLFPSSRISLEDDMCNAALPLLTQEMNLLRVMAISWPVERKCRSMANALSEAGVEIRWRRSIPIGESPLTIHIPKPGEDLPCSPGVALADEARLPCNIIGSIERSLAMYPASVVHDMLDEVVIVESLTVGDSHPSGATCHGAIIMSAFGPESRSRASSSISHLVHHEFAGRLFAENLSRFPMERWRQIGANQAPTFQTLPAASERWEMGWTRQDWKEAWENGHASPYGGLSVVDDFSEYVAFVMTGTFPSLDQMLAHDLCRRKAELAADFMDELGVSAVRERLDALTAPTSRRLNGL